MTVYENINRLISYALKTSLITNQDIIYTQNKLLELFKLDGFESIEQAKAIPLPQSTKIEDLDDILSELLEYAAKNKLFEDSGIISRDLFDTKIMGLLVPPPSDIIEIFNTLKTDFSAKHATNWYYKFSADTNYIRRNRICKDIYWKADTKFGVFDLAINLSKPEKDSASILALKNAKTVGYPPCLLCYQNEGYAGRINHAARQTLRVIPLKLAGENWYMQYSPYVYFNEHCIVFSENHVPMKIEEKTFERLLDFVTQFPHYTLGSNAGLPIVGGSILTHNHFQGGCYSFPITKAAIEKSYRLKMYPNVKAYTLKWPMAVIRLSCKYQQDLVKAATHIFETWQAYSDETVGIFAQTDGQKHNTLTPIARKNGTNYELDLVLRNNLTSSEYPEGIFHPHPELFHIKKENIGLIEVMGFAVLPSRLKSEFEMLGKAICNKQDIRAEQDIAKHADWTEDFIKKYEDINQNNIDQILKNETAKVFVQVLDHASVFKRDSMGINAFHKFMEVARNGK